MKSFIIRTILGALFFALIGSLASCTTTHATYKSTITPNTTHYNEGEYIKLNGIKKQVN